MMYKPDRLIYSGPTIFNHSIILDYYDGPMSGLLYRADTAQSYSFRLVAWDDMEGDGNGMRLYLLHEYPGTAFEELTRSAENSRRGKEFYATWRWDDENRSRVQSLIVGDAEVISSSLLLLNSYSDSFEKSIVLLALTREEAADLRRRRDVVDIDEWLPRLLAKPSLPK